MRSLVNALARLKALANRLGFVPVRSTSNSESDGSKKELTRTRAALQETRRKLTHRDRELASLRSGLGESSPQMAATPSLEGPAPFFILGPPKSGTSWLQGALNSHPEIFCSGEGKFFGRSLKTDNPYGQWGAEVSAAMTGLGYQTADRASLYSAIMDSKDLDRWFRRNGGWTENAETEQHMRALVRLAMDYLFAEARARSGKPIAGDKSPAHIQYLEEIHEFYPDARIIHIIRDGRDQAVPSVFYWWRHAKDLGGFFPLAGDQIRKRDAYYENRKEFAPYKRSIFSAASLKALAANWRETVSNAVENGPRLFDDRYFDLRYEDLLVRPEESFTDLVRFLGADAEEDLIREMVEKTSFERVSGNRSVGVEDPESFYRKGVAGDWKNYFTERDRQIYEREAGDLLVKLGYEELTVGRVFSRDREF